MKLNQLDIKSTLEAYRSREFKPSELVEVCLKEITARNTELNAFLEVRPEESLKRARELDTQISQVEKLPLFGIPIAVKDNFLVKGWQCTAASKILEGYRSPYTATSVQRLEAAGAIVIGKTNLDEFAMGSSNENSAYGIVRNPWDTARVPGGSSGGSAAALAAGLCLGSLGTDTGGSIRQPASFCGIVGMKPTYGRVSRYGIVAFGSSLDQVGPFGLTVWDTARLLEVMAGYGGHDATTSRAVVPVYTQELAVKKKFRVGIYREWVSESLDAEVRKNFEESLKILSTEGCEIVDIELPHAKFGISSYYLIAPSEASSNLARFDGAHYGFRAQGAQTVEETYSKTRGEGFGREVKMRIMLGTYALSAGYYDAFYNKANQVRQKIQEDFERAFEKCDVIASPTSPSTAFKVGEKSEDPISMYLSDVYTIPANMAGIPAMSLPSGLDSKKLPIGLQFFGKRFDESTLFEVGDLFERGRGQFRYPEGIQS